MQIFKTFLCVIFIVGLSYSCEPEELPGDLSTASANEINPSDTGDETNPNIGSQDNGEDEDEVDDGPQ